uniref:tRNA (guanine-N(7)-)-methyltransferase non-catalytic subunit WDR4 n=1 Tax=Xiphophorus couchianus TaxID=32473 RepID=A0A3B5LSL2_9TELE
SFHSFVPTFPFKKHFLKIEPFVFDCSRAEKRLKIAKDVNSSDASEDTGSDTVLAFAVSSSGKLMAITDDTKRLILFQCEPSWHCISIRWVIRRCTSLVFSPAEDELLVADKSGDVYSFSVVEPEKDGELKMGHLSMLLAVTISADDQYIITADRDEKIRVSHRRSPYNIQSYCLGHHQLMNVYIFTLEQTNDEKLRLHSKLHLFHRPMDIGFDMKGQLWVLLDSSDVPLQIHTYRKNSWEVWLDSNLHTSRYKLIILFLTSILLLIIYFYFILIIHLYKVSFDNVSVYLQKKQQRIEEHQLKRTKGQKTKCTKKSKKKPDEVLTQPST